ncbi:hypothetical protein K440DRAFT_662417 [Wilcoxina mikolae CBS 423.85]|nr:hypothetical protein K440DRAFT_662417 [Wilcoxina mikolae CBS 423.85]
MDSIFNKVKDAVVDKALRRDEDQDTSGRHGNESSYGSSGRNEREGYGSHQSSSYGRDNDSYGGSRHEGGYTRDTNERSREEIGYSTHGDRRQSPSRYEDSSRDTRGYSRESVPENRSYYEESSDFGGHGGRPVSSRIEDDRYDSSAREYRPAQGSGGYGYSSDYSGAKEHAERNASSGNSSLFSTALGFLSGKEKDLERDDVDEGEYVRNHKDLYEEDGGRGQKDSKSLGQAAALQALKKFTGGSGSGSSSGAGKDQNAFIGLAMAEAVKLFDTQKSKGNVASGETKQDVVSQAAQFALKLFLKSKFDAASGGSSGGSSGLMSLAGQFLK